MPRAGLHLVNTTPRHELRRRELADSADAYLADLLAEVGEPTQVDIAYAREVVRGIRDGDKRATG